MLFIFDYGNQLYKKIMGCCKKRIIFKVGFILKTPIIDKFSQLCKPHVACMLACDQMVINVKKVNNLTDARIRKLFLSGCPADSRLVYILADVERSN